MALTAGKNIYTFKETNAYALAHTVDIKAKREIDPANFSGENICWIYQVKRIKV